MLDVQTFKVTKSAQYVSNNEIDQTNTSRMWPRLLDPIGPYYIHYLLKNETKLVDFP